MMVLSSLKVELAMFCDFYISLGRFPKIFCVLFQVFWEVALGDLLGPWAHYRRH